MPKAKTKRAGGAWLKYLLGLIIIADLTAGLVYTVGLPRITIAIQPFTDIKPERDAASATCRAAGDPDAKECVDARSAEAAERAADWAKWQTLFGALGFIGLITTLILNFVGLFAAFRATRNADAAIAIAQSQLEVSQDATRRQLRAYVAVRAFVLRDFAPGKSPVLNYIVCNDGTTPAYNLSDTSIMDIVYTHADHAKFKIQRKEKSEADLGPGRELNGGFWGAPLTSAQYNDIISGKAYLVVRGYIRYHDAFKRFRRLTYKLSLDPKSLNNPEVRLSYCTRGNEQN